MFSVTTATLRAFQSNVSRRHKKTRRTTRFESLEQRQLLAADGAPQLGAILLDAAPDGEPAEYSVLTLPPATFQDAGLLIDHGNAPNGLPLLSSNPSATAKIYLDFDGHFEPQWGSYSNITTPAWSLDSNPSTFNATEADRIRTIWQRVAEDFAPFNVDITTIEPDSFANREGLRVSIGGSGAWFGNATGLAYLNTWTNTIANTVYVFPGRLSNNAKYIAEVASHEVGHAMGLHHQSTYNSSGSLTNEYSPGSGNWAPIMGNGLTKAHTTWHNGRSLSATTYQDDLAVISRDFNGFGYRQDDHGDLSDPTPLTLDTTGQAQTVGIIERNDDVDAFSFIVNSAANGSFQVETFAVGPNLKAVLELWSDDGQLLVQANPDATFGASFTYELDPGNYTLAVRNHGVYGSLGHYTVKVDIDEITLPPVALDDFFQVESGSDYVVIDVMANDTTNASPGQVVTIGFVSIPDQGGSVEILDGTRLRYRPAPGFLGLESFTYMIHDGTAVNNAFATVFVEVQPAPTTPITDPISDNDTDEQQEVEPQDEEQTEEDDATARASYIRFSDYSIDTYGGANNDYGSPATVLDNGATLHLPANAWKKINFSYEITRDTVLEFDFWSSSEGATHGIGFNNTVGATWQRTFDVFGTGSIGTTTYNVYGEQAPGVHRFTIPVGQHYRGEFRFLFFFTSHKVEDATGESNFSNVRVYENIPGEVPPALPLAEPVTKVEPENDPAADADAEPEPDPVVENDHIDFRDYSIDTYGGARNDYGAPAEVLDDGATLHLPANAWKKINFSYEITSDTILEFDFWSSSEGATHGIGFNNTVGATWQRTFDVFGTGSIGTTTYNVYGEQAPGVHRFTIPVGQYYRGEFRFLFFFTSDKVEDATGESNFSNVRVFENSAPEASVAQGPLHGPTPEALPRRATERVDQPEPLHVPLAEKVPGLVTSIPPSAVDRSITFHDEYFRELGTRP